VVKKGFIYLCLPMVCIPVGLLPAFTTEEIDMIDTIKQIQFQGVTEVYISESGYLCISQESLECGKMVIHTIAKNNIDDFIKLCTEVQNGSR
jgi:hypothetical protein